MEQLKSEATEEQILYANILNVGMLIGLIGLAICFILYSTGILSPLIPLEEVSAYWQLSVHEYLEESGIKAGWNWIQNLNNGDMLNFLPIALLSLLTVVCYLAILPGLIRKKDTAYIILCILEVIVLAVAASGILGSGGH